MRRDTARIQPFNSSFLSVEKDLELILKKLFVENKPFSDILKRLLIINANDCLNIDTLNKEEYVNIVNQKSVKDLIQEGYIKTEPKISFGEHEEVKNYIFITFDNFTPNFENPEYRDCIISFDILCHTDCWNIGNYRLRPFKIIGCIDAILNETKLTGIGTLHFMGCTELILDENLSGYTLTYQAIHGNDDNIEDDDV